VLRAEHRQIERFLDAIEAKMGDPAADLSRLRADLKRVLSDHNVKEEMVLYPGTDRLMSEGERDELVRRIQEFERPG
jgi:hemerythrin superfamily protein